MNLPKRMLVANWVASRLARRAAGAKANAAKFARLARMKRAVPTTQSLLLVFGGFFCCCVVLAEGAKRPGRGSEATELSWERVLRKQSRLRILRSLDRSIARVDNPKTNSGHPSSYLLALMILGKIV